MVGAAGDHLGLNVGRLVGQQQRAIQEVSWKVFLVADLVDDIAAGTAITAGLVLLGWWLRTRLSNRGSR